MALPEVQQSRTMGEVDQHVPSDADLRAWDWIAETRRQDRSFGWLGRKTDRSAGAVSRYAHGSLSTPIEWLRDVWRILDPGRAA